MALVHALSFDIEDWFHLVEIPAVAEPKSWDSFPTIVENRTDWILDRLDEHQVRATFFVLGWIAQKYPALINRIHSRGHELASHAYWHRRLDQLTRQEFRQELRESMDAIQQAASARVIGFRAPSFSVTPGAEWILDELLDAGIEYDSSLFPARRGHGGYPGCRLEPHLFHQLPSGRAMPELPMSVMQLGPLRIPFSGGGYLRLLPTWAIRSGFRQLTSAGRPVVVYLHPRDFDPNCPRVPMPWMRRFKCYVGLRTSQRKLRQLLTTYQFDTCQSVVNHFLNHGGRIAVKNQSAGGLRDSRS